MEILMKESGATLRNKDMVLILIVMVLFLWVV